MAVGAARTLQMPRKIDSCLCGSRKTFRECCRDHLPGRQIHEARREPARKKQWRKVLLAMHAELTQYPLYHRTDTVPLMQVALRERLDVRGGLRERAPCKYIVRHDGRSVARALRAPCWLFRVSRHHPNFAYFIAVSTMPSFGSK